MPLSLPPAANARVITVAAKRCRLEFAGGERVEAITRGKLLAEGLVVGDLVRAEQYREDWAVEEVLPRKNEFVREGLRHERQVLFANADRVLILASLSEPQTKYAAIDRFLVAALIGNIPPLLVLTKTDLDPEKNLQNEVRDLYEAFDVPVFPVSNVSGEGIENVAAVLGDGITALVGNSGVGKTSLLNRLIPGLFLRVREVSSWSGKGTHTTSAALLVRWSDSAAVVDTPGMKSFVPFGITLESLADLFPDIVRHAADCRFRNCRHLAEPGCAVNAAAERGDLAPSRLRSYHRLMEGLR
ncbi:ribosome small subunit-dependent GTPase A [candidate division KSB1 bacterium]|nr:MAG: ribosome small subunit-dependent GTPase A [candidate division KSB1 bacterium]